MSLFRTSRETYAGFLSHLIRLPEILHWYYIINTLFKDGIINVVIL